MRQSLSYRTGYTSTIIKALLQKLHIVEGLYTFCALTNPETEDETTGASWQLGQRSDSAINCTADRARGPGFR